MSSTRVGAWVTIVLAVVGIVWLAWVWSPTATQPAQVDADTSAGPSSAQTSAAPSASAVEAPKVVATPARVTLPDTPASEHSGDAPVERIPTPHPMSLEQARPPEQWGALRELKGRYDSESRTEASSGLEAQLRALLTTPNVPANLIDDLSCRRTVCRLTLHWMPTLRLGYVVVFESLKQLYNQRVAVEPAARQAADGNYPTTLYIQIEH